MMFLQNQLDNDLLGIIDMHTVDKRYVEIAVTSGQVLQESLNHEDSMEHLKAIYIQSARDCCREHIAYD